MLPQAQIKWRCRRGTKELDYLLVSYFDDFFSQSNSIEQELFIELLNLQDSQLISYLLGKQLPKPKGLAALVKKIRSSSYL